MLFVDETTAIPLPILHPDGLLRIVFIPHLDEEGFNFLKRQLNLYKPAIVHKSETPAEERAIGSGDALPGEVA